MDPFLFKFHTLNRIELPGSIISGLQDFQIFLCMAALKFGSCSQIWIFFKHNVFAGFWEIVTGQRGHFQNLVLFCGNLKMGPGHFSRISNFRISCSSHSENAHVKLNGGWSLTASAHEWWGLWEALIQILNLITSWLNISATKTRGVRADVCWCTVVIRACAIELPGSGDCGFVLIVCACFWASV